MKLRRAELEDAQGIARVHVQSWKETYPGIIPEAILKNLSLPEREAAWRNNLKDAAAKRFNFVAEARGEVVGFSSGGPLRCDRHDFSTALKQAYDGEFYAIYLLKSHQGQKIGRALFHEVCRELLLQKYKSMLVWVLKDNPTCKFYEAMGGTRAGETKIKIGRELDELAYGWNPIPASG